MKAIQVTEFGGPEVLVLSELPEPEPVEGFVGLAVSAAGINYADTHQVENSYLSPATLPLIPGAEVVGTTPDGRRLAGLLAAGGGYAEHALVSPYASVEVPDGVSDGDALATVLQGATAWHLLRTSARMQPGETVVVHAGAGGVGTLAIQLAKAWGAGTVIATASSEEKRALALELGADAAISGAEDGLADAIKEAAGGRVDIVLEMVGGQTFGESLKTLAPFGRLVTYGMASRALPEPVAPGALMHKSLSIIGFWLASCFTRPGMYTPAVEELLGMVADGSLRPVIGGTYALADARQAHEALLARKTVGKLVLTT